MMDKAIQDYYADEVAVCYGCGRNNAHGLQIKTYWDGKEGVARFTPLAHHTAFPGFVYGGLIASLVDCHCTGTATAASYDALGLDPASDTSIRFVTGTLKVRYIRPTPTHTELVLRARIQELKTKKVIVTCSVYAGEKECAQAEVIAIRAPKEMFDLTT
jgi:acyl-coenzyme A thioesterase PaaI-like protein